MSVTIVSEPHEEGMHPTLPQLVRAASIIGGSCTVIIPGGNGADEASKIQGVEKVIKLNGACFSVFDSSTWSAAISGLVDGTPVLKIDDLMMKSMTTLDASERPGLIDVE